MPLWELIEAIELVTELHDDSSGSDKEDFMEHLGYG